MYLRKRPSDYASQINELRQYMNGLDEKIARFRKQDKDPGQLIENKVRARKTIEQLEQAKKGNTTPLHGLR